MRLKATNFFIHDPSILKLKNSLKIPKHKYFKIKFTVWYLGGDQLGEDILKSIGCPATNCFFTHNRQYLKNYTDFDVVLFHASEYLDDKIPPLRSPKQLYVFNVLE